LGGSSPQTNTARVSNVVFMGMGEPLANYASVLAAVRRLTDPVPEGMGISQRSVTVSTVGLVPAIARLAAERLSVTLAVSLHAPDDGLRDTLVPVNQRWKVAEVLAAAWNYAAATGRRVSIEYALIKDINDQAWRADLLGSLLAGRLAHVNLIPLNPTPGSKWTASRPAAQREFVRRLEAHGVPVTVRDTRGREIDNSKPSRRIVSISTPSCNSPRPATSNASFSLLSLTRIATLPSASRNRRSPIMRDVTLVPSRPASGLSLTENVIASVGGSIGSAASGIVTSGAQIVSATVV